MFFNMSNQRIGKIERVVAIRLEVSGAI